MLVERGRLPLRGGAAMTQQIVYDIETYPNCFCLVAESMTDTRRWVFEVSSRRNDLAAMVEWLSALGPAGWEMIGFNNLAFDYPVIHEILTNWQCRTTAMIYLKAKSIIDSQDRFGTTIWPSDRFVPQIDLFKIHHFDNQARSTGLKALQINMRSESVEDLPFPVGRPVPEEHMDTLIRYCVHDVTETKAFAIKSKEAIDLRRSLTAKYNRDFMNHNDTKIGKDYLIMCLGEDLCYTRASGRREPRQTPRASIALGEVILPYVAFQHPEFNRVLSWFRQRVITETKGVIDDLTCAVGGFTFTFGTGGIHGSVESTIVRADDDYAIWDWDVTSFYPMLGIVNHLYPEHLTDRFCAVYKEVFEERQHYPKGTPENAMYKLALNGVYGDSNNQYSPFYDPKYTMSITINGQLSLCMLAEQLLNIPDLQMIQVNTDGLTIRIPRVHEWLMHLVCQWWQGVTGLTLESAQYRLMNIRDCNNYQAVGLDGKVKLKGAYLIKRGWHQDQSALIIPMAAEAVMVRGEDLETFIRGHTDPFDFMCRAKVPRNSMLMMGDRQVQNTTRYYVSTDGQPLVKVSPPVEGAIEGQYKRKNGVSERDYKGWHEAWGNTWSPDVHTANKSIYETRRMSINAGWKGTECNRAIDFRWSNLEYQWYIEEARKLIL